MTAPQAAVQPSPSMITKPAPDVTYRLTVNKRVKPSTCEICSADFMAFRASIGRFCGRACQGFARRRTTTELQQYADGSVGLPLKARDGSVRAYAIVDAADAEWASQWSWSLDTHGYAMRTDRESRSNLKLHRELLGLTHGDGFEGDHIDRNTLNDRRLNLRSLPTIGRPNQQNKKGKPGSTSIYRGVSWRSDRKQWIAQVKIVGKPRFTAYFNDELEAAEVAYLMRLELMPYAVD